MFIFTFSHINHSGLHSGCHIMLIARHLSVASFHRFSWVSCESAKLMDEHNREIAVRAIHCQPSGPYMFPVIEFWNACHFLYFKQTVFISFTVEYWLWRRRRKQCDLLIALGWHDQCQLLYHKWWSWWNTQSYTASCTEDSVNINRFLSRCWWYVGRGSELYVLNHQLNCIGGRTNCVLSFILALKVTGQGQICTLLFDL